MVRHRQHQTAVSMPTKSKTLPAQLPALLRKRTGKQNASNQRLEQYASQGDTPPPHDTKVQFQRPSLRLFGNEEME
jgi:hypothetical protein